MHIFLPAAATARGYSAAGASQLQVFQLTLCQYSPMSVRQIGKSKISESNTDKMFDATPNRFKHPPDLPVYSLTQHNPQTGGRDGVESLNFGSFTVQKNSAQYFRREYW